MAKKPTTKKPTATAPETENVRTRVMHVIEKPQRKKPIMQEHRVDAKPRKDPRTGKPEIPGQPTSRAGIQPKQTPKLAVRATRMTYYNLKRRHEGDIYHLTSEEHFNPKAMEWVHPRSPERTTSAQEALNAKGDDIKERRGRGETVAVPDPVDDVPQGRAAGDDEVDL